MLSKHKNLLTATHCDELLDLYRSANNTVVIDGVTRDRHTMSAIGKFMLSEFTKEEFKKYWTHINSQLTEDFELIYVRILKYTKGCEVEVHQDVYAQFVQETGDTSMIIALTDQDVYEGGESIVMNRSLKQKKGDSIYYSYDTMHGVTPVTKGIRYVVNLRLKSVK
jgi:predicted 2-oxoglutarate/Fe(II)-dependent dioxygenase YbiX